MLLERLQGAKQTAPGRWLARCPSHEDHSPSLSIRELDDGRVLIYDFAGCDTQTVLEALGLEMAALFPERLPGSGPAGGYARSHSRIPAADALAALDHELTVACLLIEAAAIGAPVEEGARVRLRQAAARLGAARDLCAPLAVRHA